MQKSNLIYKSAGDDFFYSSEGIFPTKEDALKEIPDGVIIQDDKLTIPEEIRLQVQGKVKEDDELDLVQINDSLSKHCLPTYREEDHAELMQKIINMFDLKELNEIQLWCKIAFNVSGSLNNQAIIETNTFENYLETCIRYKLNPLQDLVYFYTTDSRLADFALSLDGYITIMNNQPDFDGVDYEYIGGTTKEIHCKEYKEDPMGGYEEILVPKTIAVPVSVKCKIYKKSFSKPIVACADISDFKDTEAWNEYTVQMLRTTALKRAIKLAFNIFITNECPDALEYRRIFYTKNDNSIKDKVEQNNTVLTENNPNLQTEKENTFKLIKDDHKEEKQDNGNWELIQDLVATCSAVPSSVSKNDLNLDLY